MGNCMAIKIILVSLIFVFFTHLTLFFIFINKPMAVTIETLSGLSVSQIYSVLNTPQYSFKEKDMIIWTQCEKYICKNIEVRVDMGNDYMDEIPDSVTVSNVYNGNTKFFALYYMVAHGVKNKRIVVWPYGDFFMK